MTPRVSALCCVAGLIALVGCDSTEPARYSEGEIDYFVEIAVGTEFSDEGEFIRRWAKDIRVRVIGDATPADLDVVNAVVSEVNGLVSAVRVAVVAEGADADINIVFAPQSEFPDLDPLYVPGNEGFFVIGWDRSCEIQFARILIASDLDSDRRRAHLIREELTQSLGLPQDSFRYPGSIFYQRASEVTEYLPIDRAVIEMLYRPEVDPCMNSEAVRAALRRVRA